MPWYINKTDRGDITDYYYLTVVPYSRIHNKAVMGYKDTLGVRTINLDSNTTIKINVSKNDYEVSVGGNNIAGHYATFCPLDSNRIAFYSRYASEQVADIPDGWDTAAVCARALFTDRLEAVGVRIFNSKIHIRLFILFRFIISIYLNLFYSNA